MTAPFIMYWVVIVVVTYQVVRSNGQLDSSYLPWRTTLDKHDDSKDLKVNQCKLPPALENVNYVVVDATGAGAGELYQNLSIVQYIDDNFGYSKLKLLRCSSGRWTEYVFEYNSEKLYFNVSWCPILCPHIERVITPASTTQVYETLEETNPDLCVIPLDSHGKDYELSGIERGNGYDYFRVHQFSLNETSKVYEVAAFICKNGRWVVDFADSTIDGRESFTFKKRDWCSLLCKASVVEMASETSEQSISFANRLSEENKKSQSNCELPPYPEGGNYTAVHRPEAAPGDAMGAVHLTYSCFSNRKLIGKKDIYCIEGVWSDVQPKCIRCGWIRSSVLEQTSAEDAVLRELPWHVAIYDKRRGFQHIRSGSIAATNLVVTAAHCLWNEAEGPQPASSFAVVAGHIYGDWSSTNDARAQKSDVVEITIHPRFRGNQTSYQNNIALIFLADPLNFTDYVSSVCVDFNEELDDKQLTDRSFGKIFSWSSASDTDTTASKLKVAWKAYIDANKCIFNSSTSLRQYVTSDKICAGNAEDITLCDSDGGGSLSYHVWEDDGSRVNYLRGVASAAPTDEKSCNVHPVSVYTHILHHKNFLEKYLNEAIW